MASISASEESMTLTEGALIRAIETGVFHIPFVKDPDGDDSHTTSCR